MANTLRRLRVSEISSVDRGAGDGVHVVLTKREFTAEERQRAAASGAAMPGGEYPIETKADLHNAIQAFGRAKDPAATKRHIIARARTLGATSELPEEWNVEKGLFAKTLAALGWGSPTPADKIAEATEALRKSVDTILADAALDAAAKSVAVTKTFAEYSEHLGDTIPESIAKALAEAGITVTKEGQMTTDAEKAAEEREKRRKARKERGMNEEREEKAEAHFKANGKEPEAQEDDAISELQDAQRREREAGEKRKALLKSVVAKMSAEHKEFHDKLDGDDAKERFAAKSPEDRDKEMKARTEKSGDTETEKALTKSLTDLADMQKRMTALEDDKALTGFQKRAVGMGLREEDGDTLMKAERGDVAAVRKLTDMLGAATAAAREAGIFKEFGSRGSGAGDTALEQFTAKAEELRKADPKLTFEQAFEKVFTDPANAVLKAVHKRETARISDAD